MTVNEIFDTEEVMEIEREILLLEMKIENGRYHCRKDTNDVMLYLLNRRKKVLDSKFVMDLEHKRLLGEFNDALKEQLIEMRQRTIDAYEAVAETANYPSIRATGKCFLGYDYSTIHPVDTIRAQKIWGILNGSLGCYQPTYENGIPMCGYTCDRGGCDSEMDMLYLGDTVRNFNQLPILNTALTSDMAIIYPVMELLEEQAFSIFDLLWVRDFNMEIHVETDYDTDVLPRSDTASALDWSKLDWEERKEDTDEGDYATSFC